jgi:hypothetical protein
VSMSWWFVTGMQLCFLTLMGVFTAAVLLAACVALHKAAGDALFGGDTLARFWKEQGEWSQKTFGSDSVRGPAGPTRHLAREVLTELLGVPRPSVDRILLEEAGGPIPNYESYKEEFVDCFFLVVDAARRAGFTRERFARALFLKLEKNKARIWPAIDPNNLGDAVEHVRGNGEGK